MHWTIDTVPQYRPEETLKVKKEREEKSQTGRDGMEWGS